MGVCVVRRVRDFLGSSGLVYARTQLDHASLRISRHQYSRHLQMAHRLIFGFVVLLLSLPTSAFAYHDTLRGGGSIGVVLPIIIVVVIGMVGLGIWDRKMRKTKSKRKRKRKRR